MEIVATARLQYWLGESISSGWERLELIVKFKEDSRLFKRKLTKHLASTFDVVNSHLSFHPLNSYDEYFVECEKYLNDTYLVKKVAEDMIRNYFNKKNQNQSRNDKSKEIQTRASKLGKIEVKVKII